VERPFEDFSGSALAWASVLDAIRLSDVPCRSVFLSSAAVYGPTTDLPTREQAEQRPISPYGYHKQMCERLSEYYVNLFGLEVSTLRLFSAYGAGLRKQIMWDVCQKAIGGKTIMLLGSGTETRDFVEVRDIATAVETVLLAGDFSAGVYNVGSGSGTLIRQVAERLVFTLGTGNDIEFTGTVRAGDPLHYQADTTKVRSLGWKPIIPIERGIADYAHWFLAECSPRAEAPS